MFDIDYLADGTLEIHATIDTTGYTITEASIRDKLHLADASGITMLPNNEIFDGMGQMGYPTDRIFHLLEKLFHTPMEIFSPPSFALNMKRGFRGALRPLLSAMLLVASTNPNAGQAHTDVAPSQPSSSTIPYTDLLHLVPQLMTRVDSLEKDLKQTKL
ncbi:hypothetical protein Tco_0113682 [Tanacetum coccineum]